MSNEGSDLDGRDLDALAKAAGLDPWPAWREDIRLLYPYLAAMIARVRRPPPRHAEPAHEFRVRDGRG